MGVGQGQAVPGQAVPGATAAVSPEPLRAGTEPSLRRVGVLGGTFDPFHIGHLAVALEARHHLDLDRLLVVVANDPWQKSADHRVTDAEDRYAVTAAAVAGMPGIEASRLEIDRGGPSYMADTVDDLRRRYPTAELFVVVGADVVPTLGTWHAVDRLATVATLVVATRAGHGAPDDPPGWRVLHLEVPALDVSSSDIRARLVAGRPVEALVPEAAIRCIRRRGLYAGGEMPKPSSIRPADPVGHVDPAGRVDPAGPAGSVRPAAP